MKELGVGQSLDHAEVEGGAADAASRKGETDETVFRERREHRVEASLARGADPVKFGMENRRVESWQRGHGAPSWSEETWLRRQTAEDLVLVMSSGRH